MLILIKEPNLFDQQISGKLDSGTEKVEKVFLVDIVHLLWDRIRDDRSTAIAHQCFHVESSIALSIRIKDWKWSPRLDSK